MRETLRLWLHITRRNWQVYKKDFIANTSPTLADPALIMVSLGLGLGAFLKNIQGMTYLQFLAPGLTVSTALFTSFFETSYGFYIRMTFENVFKAMLTTPIGVSEIVAGEFVWVGLKGSAFGLGVSIVLALCGLMTNPWLLPFLALVGFFVALACGALGLIATTLVRNINQFQSVYSFVIAPLYFLSGVFFPLENMARPVRIAAEFFPLIHGVRLAQVLFWNRNILSVVIYDGGILLLQSLLLCGVAYRLTRKKLLS